ncbi:hypothetical protein SDC9_199513 [bioreactor metagenome]|uniref:N-acetyltransferase domain-containing protein n=1 Tax=bioreactor metagenome TaxID=1076179 RepID=A0A645IXE0_9ZZZZ
MAGFKPHHSLLESRILLDFFITKDYGWAIYHKADQRVIGFISLNKDLKRSGGIDCQSIGYSLHRDYWGHGLMTEAGEAVIAYAFETLKLDMLSVYHYPANKQSQRVIEKLGFHYDGILRCSAKLYNDEIEDEVCYSMLKQEYFARTGN